MSHRQGEEDAVRFRSERVFAINDKWFFQTRELPEPLGPYPTREQANRCLSVFLRGLESNLTVNQAVASLPIVADPYNEDKF